MATMKDVAREAGVSLGTVSNVLNNKSTVLPGNRIKVLEAIERLDFQSNSIARSLRMNYTADIGLIIPSISNPFYAELARGVEDAANAAGFSVLICNDDREAKKERSYVKALLAKKAYGIILLKPQITLDEVSELGEAMAVVLVDVGSTVGPSYSIVNVDDRGGVSKGLELLHAHGHRKIAFLQGLNDSLSSHDRVNAYYEFMRNKKLPFPAEYMPQGDYSWKSGYEAARQLLALTDPPTAIMAANDLMAIGCMKAAQSLGLDVPGDISIVGYDNLELTNICTPRLTTIDQPKYDIGRKSVELLFRRLNGGSHKGEKIILPTQLVERESVDIVREHLCRV